MIEVLIKVWKHDALTRVAEWLARGSEVARIRADFYNPASSTSQVAVQGLLDSQAAHRSALRNTRKDGLR